MRSKHSVLSFDELGGKGVLKAPGHVLKLPLKMDEIYKADWLNDVTLAHGGIYCVVKTNENNKVICTTNAFKDGWEKANMIANALNETV